MTIEQSDHVTVDETNPKSIEVEVFDYAINLEKTLLEDQYHNKSQNQDQDKNEEKYKSKEKIEYKNNDQVKEISTIMIYPRNRGQQKATQSRTSKVIFI